VTEIGKPGNEFSEEGFRLQVPEGGGSTLKKSKFIRYGAELHKRGKSQEEKHVDGGDHQALCARGRGLRGSLEGGELKAARSKLTGWARTTRGTLEKGLTPRKGRNAIGLDRGRRDEEGKNNKSDRKKISLRDDDIQYSKAKGTPAAEGDNVISWGERTMGGRGP